MNSAVGAAVRSSDDGPSPADYPVLVVDDHELFTTSLIIALRGHGFDARGLEVARVAEFLARPRSGPAGLVVLDLDLGRDKGGSWVNGADLVADLRALGWLVLLVTAGADRRAVAAAIAFGAIGVIPKSGSFDQLLRAVLAVARGEPLMTDVARQQWLLSHRQYQARERDLGRRLDRLSAREREVLELLAQGYRAAGIAERFVVSLATVRTQIRAILVKLEVNSQLEAVALIRPSAGRVEHS